MLPNPAVAADIAGLVDEMEAAVLAGNEHEYLALVDLSDPVFALEHTRWAHEWATSTVIASYELAIENVVVGPGVAAGALTASWSVADIFTSTATLLVTFTQTQQGEWRYAGERWVTTEVEHFRIRVAPGLQSRIDLISDHLPEAYEHVTTSLEHQPTDLIEIKLYYDGWAAAFTTLLSHDEIRGWNEPGEALKLRDDPEEFLVPAIVHELTHFVGFDQAGTKHSRMPWWLEEGIATYVATPFDPPERGDERLEVVGSWAAEGSLADWTDMAAYSETPPELRPNAYGQGYALVRYVTETYGEDARIAWLSAMATEMELDEATETELGVTFDELDSQFRSWLTD